MARNTLNLLIDAVTFLLMLAMAATGLLMAFVLPPRSGHTLTLWGLDRHDWGDVHLWLAAALGVALLIHLAMHWSWVWCMVRRIVLRKEGSELRGKRWARWAAGVGILVVLTTATLLFVWVARDATRTLDMPRGRGYRGGAADRSILVRPDSQTADVRGEGAIPSPGRAGRG